jgi:hypothetical protein
LYANFKRSSLCEVIGIGVTSCLQIIAVDAIEIDDPEIVPAMFEHGCEAQNAELRLGSSPFYRAAAELLGASELCDGRRGYKTNGHQANFFKLVLTRFAVFCYLLALRLNNRRPQFHLLYRSGFGPGV